MKKREMSSNNRNIVSLTLVALSCSLVMVMGSTEVKIRGEGYTNIVAEMADSWSCINGTGAFCDGFAGDDLLMGSELGSNRRVLTSKTGFATDPTPYPTSVYCNAGMTTYAKTPCSFLANKRSKNTGDAIRDKGYG